MAHVEKWTAGAIGGLSRHCTRQSDNHKNKMIDAEKTHLNYSLDNNENPYQYFNERLGQVRINQRRDDIKVAASWAVTQPRGISPDESRKFFETAHNFLANKYGEKNVVWSRVHMDESTPHLHFCFIPVVQDKKHEGQEKVCAKDVLNRASLKSFHKELSQEMKRVFGRDVGIETGKTENSLPLEKLKVKTALDEVSSELIETKKELEAAKEARKTMVGGRELYDEIQKEKKDVRISLYKQVKIPAETMEEVEEYLLHSGGKDDEIASLKKDLEKTKAVAVKATEQVKKLEASNLEAGNELSTVRYGRAIAEQKLAAIEKKHPGILSAIEQDRSRTQGRGGR